MGLGDREWQIVHGKSDLIGSNRIWGSDLGERRRGGTQPNGEAKRGGKNEEKVGTLKPMPHP